MRMRDVHKNLRRIQQQRMDKEVKIIESLSLKCEPLEKALTINIKMPYNDSSQKIIYQQIDKLMDLKRQIKESKERVDLIHQRGIA